MDLSEQRIALQRRRAILWAMDLAAWAVGLPAAVITRYEFNLTAAQLAGTAVAVLLAVCLHSVIGHLQYLYRGRYGFGSFEEVRAVSATVLVNAVTLVAADLTMQIRPVPASAPIVGGALALVMMLGARYL